MYGLEIMITVIARCKVFLFPGCKHRIAVHFENKMKLDKTFILFVNDNSDEIEHDGILGELSYENNQLFVTIIGPVLVTYKNDYYNLELIPFVHGTDEVKRKLRELYFYSNLGDVLMKQPQNVFYPIDSPTTSDHVFYQMFRLLNHVFPLENIKARNQLKLYFDYDFYLDIMNLFIDTFKGYFISGNGLNTTIQGTLIILRYVVTSEKKNMDSLLYLGTSESEKLGPCLLNEVKETQKNASVKAKINIKSTDKKSPMTVQELCTRYYKDVIAKKCSDQSVKIAIIQEINDMIADLKESEPD